MPFSGERKRCVQLFSVTSDQIFVNPADIKARMSSNLGRIVLLALELFALECGCFPHRLIMEKTMDVSFSQLLWIQFPSNLQVTRTGIKSRTSSNYGQIWSITLELRVLVTVSQWAIVALLGDLVFICLRNVVSSGIPKYYVLSYIFWHQ